MLAGLAFVHSNRIVDVCLMFYFYFVIINILLNLVSVNTVLSPLTYGEKRIAQLRRANRPTIIDQPHDSRYREKVKTSLRGIRRDFLNIHFRSLWHDVSSRYNNGLHVALGFIHSQRLTPSRLAS